MNIALTAFTRRGYGLACSLARALEEQGEEVKLALPARLAQELGTASYERLADWTGKGAGWHARGGSADTTAPAPRGRDGSGRWLWGFSVELTIVRDFDE